MYCNLLCRLIFISDMTKKNNKSNKEEKKYQKNKKKIAKNNKSSEKRLTFTKTPSYATIETHMCSDLNLAPQRQNEIL